MGVLEDSVVFTSFLKKRTHTSEQLSLNGPWMQVPQLIPPMATRVLPTAEESRRISPSTKFRFRLIAQYESRVITQFYLMAQLYSINQVPVLLDGTVSMNQECSQYCSQYSRISAPLEQGS
jgi:hypothetical protein